MAELLGFWLDVFQAETAWFLCDWSSLDLNLPQKLEILPTETWCFYFYSGRLWQEVIPAGGGIFRQTVDFFFAFKTED